MNMTTKSRTPPAEKQRTSTDIPPELTRRAIVERVRPAIDGGRFAIKRTLGEPVQVFADIFGDGHDVVAAVLRDRPKAGSWRETPMTLVAPGTDEWAATFTVDAAIGWHEYQVVAWVDRFVTWRRDIKIKAAAGQEVALELLEGSMLLRDAAARAEASEPRDANWLLERADLLND